jgi:hypothetical protein
MAARQDENWDDQDFEYSLFHFNQRLKFHGYQASIPALALSNALNHSHEPRCKLLLQSVAEFSCPTLGGEVNRNRHCLNEQRRSKTS